MTKEEKNLVVADLTEAVAGSNVFYLADTSELNAEQTSGFRREGFKNNIKIRVVKNTLLKRAFMSIEDRDYSPMYDVLKGTTAIMFSEVGNAPAKLIKDFRKKNTRPVLKAAYVGEAIFIGDSQIDNLIALKSKEEMLGEVIGLLQSPAKNVLSALQSGGSTIAGLVKTLSEREQ